MTDTAEWKPRWASPPGRTVAALLDQRGSSASDLASLLDVEPQIAEAILDSLANVDDDLARRLSRSLGASPRFWLNRFGQYTQDCLRVEADAWAQQAPKELATSLGWVEPATDWLERIDHLMAFFGVGDIAEWKESYGSILANTQYKRTQRFASNDIAVAAWLRQAQIQARMLALDAFDGTELAALAQSARSLTWLGDPAHFIPRLTRLCGAAGIALIVLRAPSGCPVSGARHHTESGNPLICLSARHLTDDHFWFTFFHELAHVLLHRGAQTYVEDLDPEGGLGPDQKDEDEANTWAEEFILPPAAKHRVQGNRLSHEKVLRMSRELRIAPGLLVGQFQLSGDVNYGHLNRLKRRYKWVGASLEKA